MSASINSPQLLPKKHYCYAIALLLILLVFNTALALDLQNLEITKEGRIYNIHMTFRISASASQTMAVLTDYGFPDRLNPEVTARKIVSERNGITRIHTNVESCVFFFCKDVTIIQDVVVTDNVIRADIVPEEGDFRSGYLLWSVTRTNDGNSRIAFEASMEPDFFIPPLIGGYFVRKRLREEILKTAQNLDTQAVQEPAL